MCGIHAAIELVTGPANKDRQNDDNSTDPISDALRRRLASRGPDHLGQAAAQHAPAHGRHRFVLRFTSTVLALRGDGLAAQPFVDPASGAVLCWNGEAWKVGADEVAGNDGEQLFQRLTAVSSRYAPSSDDGAYRDAILAVLCAIEGPFAFVYYDGRAGRLYYGRDRLGRRSLLARRDKSGVLTLSSVADVADASPVDDAPWAEVEADGISVVDLEQYAPSTSSTSSVDGTNGGVSRYGWATEDAADPFVVSGLGRFNMATDPPLEGSSLIADAPSVQALRHQLAASLRLRVRNVPKPPALTVAATPAAQDTRVAVLFSGGLDCTVLARMAHDLLPADQGIDLINVAFENPRVVSHLGPGVADVYEACPDRVTGRKSFAELQRACPGRAWRFLAVNIPYTETVAHRPEIVSLMHPHNTEMDLSIASALYFAARGVGRTEDESFVPTACATPARVLLSGLGADELFGGYGRHGIAFARRGYAGLAEELRVDVARLGRRNLGRDDRVLAHWGREVRFPFLDEALVRWAIALPAWEKCDFANAGGQEDDDDDVEPAKRVLRLVALSLGMAGVAREKKRAIQFGARTAKMESGRVKGTALIT